MPILEENVVDPFSVTVLIASVLVMVFLIISTIYFSNLMKLKPPSKSESTFLFWTSLLLAILITVIAVLAIIHIFTHKHITHIVENKIVTPQAPIRKNVVSKSPPAITQTPKSVIRPTQRTSLNDGFELSDMSSKNRNATKRNLELFDDEED
jgi:heme/copper-type cytochrome/quinol oxidase subunit 2